MVVASTCGVALTRSVLGDTMNALAVTYGELGRDQDALVLLEKTLEFQRRVLPENHQDIGVMRSCLLIVRVTLTRSVLGTAMGNLAGTYCKLGRDQDALVLREKTLEFRRRVLPENHPDIGLSCFNISSSYGLAGEFHRAIDRAREALRIFQAALPPSHPHVKMAHDHVRMFEGALARRA